MNLQDTTNLILEVDGFQIFNDLKNQALEEIWDLGLPILKFTDTIVPNKIVASTTYSEYTDRKDFYIVNKLLKCKNKLEMGYQGQTIIHRIRKEVIIKEVSISVSVVIERALPPDYIGALVGLGKLTVTSSSVQCNI